MRTRASILGDLRALRPMLTIRLPRAERNDLSRRMRALQRELRDIRASREGASSPRKRSFPVCIECRREITGKPYDEEGFLGAWCSETCFDAFQDRKYSR